MASDDQNSGTSVTRETLKGAAKGAAAPFVAAGVTVAGTAALATAVVAPPVVAWKLSGKIHNAAGRGWKGAAAVAAVWLAGAVISTTAAIGGMLGFGKGVSKSSSERVAARENNDLTAAPDAIQVAAQQAYIAGAQAGQAHVINEIRKAQEAQLAQQAAAQPGSFAAKVGQPQNTITPEAIRRQQEVAAAASSHIA